jgi:predicted AAA+ superfamily ATPase
MIIQRALHNIIEQFLFKNKAIIIYGARQVGKTTLVQINNRKISGNCIIPQLR